MISFSRKDLFHTVMFHRHYRTAAFFRDHGCTLAALLHDWLAERHRRTIRSHAREQGILELVKAHHRLGLALLDTEFRRYKF